MEKSEKSFFFVGQTYFSEFNFAKKFLKNGFREIFQIIKNQNFLRLLSLVSRRNNYCFGIGSIVMFFFLLHFFLFVITLICCT